MRLSGVRFSEAAPPAADLYVVFTRARRKTVVLTFGPSLPALIDPIARLARSEPMNKTQNRAMSAG